MNNKNKTISFKFSSSEARKSHHDSDTQTNKPEWQTIAFFKRVSLQYYETTFLKRKLYLHSLYFSQNMLMLSEPRRVLVICILFLDFARFAILSSPRMCTNLCKSSFKTFKRNVNSQTDRLKSSRSLPGAEK